VIRYLLRATPAHFRAGRTLFLLSLAGVALGVAAVLSIQIINRSALGAFAGGVRAVSTGADLSLLGRGPALEETLVADVLGEPGVTAAWPVYQIDVLLDDPRPAFLEILGTDLFAARRLPWKASPEDPAAVVGEPGWVAITPTLAAQRGWSLGDRIEVTSGSRRVALQVGALVDFQRLSPLASRRLAVMDIAQAQSLFGRRGEIHQIDVQAEAGADPAELAARLSARLPPTVEVLTPAEREEQASGLLGAFRLNLTALSLISLFVGGFLVYASTQASLVRRRAELGLLRSLGATRRQVLLLIFVEVVLLGFFGVALGLPLGYLAATASVDKVSATVANIYLLDEIENVVLPARLFALALAMGIAGALAGSLLPALDMSRRDTRSLLAAFSLHEKVSAASPWLLAGGLGFLAAVGSFCLAMGSEWKPGGFVLAVALLLALPLATPFLLERAAGLIPSRGFGLLYGIKSLGRQIQTTSFAIAALAVAASMLVGITLMIGSFRRTVAVWIESTVRADVYISTKSWRRARREATMDEALIAALAGHPGVRGIDRLRQFFVEVEGRRVPVSGVEGNLTPGDHRVTLFQGDPGEAFRRVREEGAVLVGEPLARRSHLSLGDPLVLPGRRASVAFPVAGVYYDYTSESGSVLMAMSTMEEAFGPGPTNNIALYLESGQDAERVVDELKARFREAPLDIRSNRRLREEVLSIFDQTFAVTRLLELMSLAVAASGIALGLLILARERTAELALYRSLGAVPAQIFRIFLGKGAGMAFFGLALGGASGTVLSFILIYLINRAYFGWTINFHVPWPALARAALTILLGACLASIYPALRASQTPASELSCEDV
jgi:putative ABC transport system permease protein